MVTTGSARLPKCPTPVAGIWPACSHIRKFGNGERVKPFMRGLIKVLKEEEPFAKLCVRCHGEQARGDATIARLAGQQVPYLQTSIMRYRDNTGVRNNQLMSIATATLKNDDIKAIANYLTQLP